MQQKRIGERRANGRLSPEQRILRARVAAHVMHARHNTEVVSRPGREAFLDRFDREVDPDGVLPVKERRRRAEHAKRAHMTKLALRSARNRRARAAASGAEMA